MHINLTLGTAGHIDHGKTALVRALTGCETDRLKEEKERGMSIELGYAPCSIADLQVGIVDVPGHENFIKTMVAGASGMDGVVLVVAADDGVMPQTREHLDILTLLGIRHGLVALTKIDRVTPEQRELAMADVAELVRGTFLEAAPVLPISNITGEGFDAFYTGLESLVRSIRPKRIDGVFRLPLERAFSVKGYGTVVAGIPVAGAARAGDEVVLLPGNVTGRIKRIEVYGQTSDAVMAGQCAALNVGHWDPHAIGRGDTLTLPGYFAPRQWYVATLRLLDRPKLSLKNGAEVKFHTGTAEVLASVYAVSGDRMQGGNEYLVQLRAKSPVVAGPGDHFILRTVGPVATVGGGTIIEAIPGRLKRNRANLAEDLQERAQAIGDERRWAEYCVRRADTLAATPAELAQRAKIPRERLQEILAKLAAERVVLPLGPTRFIHRTTAAEAMRQVLAAVADFHRREPASPGLTLEELRLACSIDKDVLDGLIALLKAENRLVERNQRLAAAEHRATFADEDARLLEAVETLVRQSGFHALNRDEIVAQAGQPAARVDKSIKLLTEHQRLVLVEGMFFHADAIARAKELLVAHLQQKGRLDSVEFKYILDTTRKYALPLLDYFDRIGVTRRVGNTRFLKVR